MIRFLLPALLLSACYQTPSDGDQPDPQAPTLDRIDTATPLADGATLLEFEITTAEGTKASTPIVVEVSTGTINMSALPGSAESRKLQFTVGSEPSRTVKVRTGITPGPLTIVATIGNHRLPKDVILVPSRPHGVTLTASRTRLPANGSDTVVLTASLWPASSLERDASAPFAQVSAGSRVTFAVCCSNGERGTKHCEQLPPPLRVPALAETTTTPSLSITAVSEHRTGTRNGETIDLVVIADVSDGWATCDEAASTDMDGGVGTRASVPVSLQLQAPPAADGGT